MAVPEKVRKAKREGMGALAVVRGKKKKGPVQTTKLVDRTRSTAEKRRLVAEGAANKAVLTKPAMTRAEIEAYVDEKLAERFPDDAPVGGPVGQFLEAVQAYMVQHRAAPEFGVVPEEMMAGLDVQLSGKPQWGRLSEKKRIAGVKVIAAKTRAIQLGR
jgi:hypothetical protein